MVRVGGHAQELDVRPIDGPEGEWRVPVAKEHPVLSRCVDVVGIALNQDTVLREDGIVVLNIQVSAKEPGKSSGSSDRQHSDDQGDGNEDCDLLPLSYAHGLSE